MTRPRSPSPAGCSAWTTPASSRAIVEAAIASQPEAAEKVEGGEGKAIGAIVGAVMKETKGRADGGEVTRLIREKQALIKSFAQSAILPLMAHNVVIAGGGFAGANAARELERILPRQSTRLVLVNDVNFMLYTPLLPEAAAGTLEPRHVVTPLRDILKRTTCASARSPLTTRPATWSR